MLGKIDGRRRRGRQRMRWFDKDIVFPVVMYGRESWTVKKAECRRIDAFAGLIPGLGRSPGEGNGDPLQYSCLENPMDGGAC